MSLRSRRAAILTAIAVAVGGTAVAILPTATSSAAVSCAGVAAWAEGNSFTVGQNITYNGRLYQALVTHTAHPGAGWNPAATPSLWRNVDVCSSTPTTPPPTTRPPTTPPPTTPPPTTPPPTTPPPNTGLPKHALIGYHHTTFANGSGYLRLADVPAAWDIINLSFGEPTTDTSGDIRFTLCPVAKCPNVETESQFIAAVAAKRAAGKKVLLSIGGENGTVKLVNFAARDKFVESVSAIIDKYGLDGLDIDFEGQSLYLEANDTDVNNPTTSVIVNLIAAVKSLKAKYGSRFVLTMAPETFFVQIGLERYGPGPQNLDARAGAYLPVINALRNELTVLHVQNYNSGQVRGLDGAWHAMGDAKFHVAMTDMLLTGFTLGGTNGGRFEKLPASKVAFGAPAAVSAGNGYVGPSDIQAAVKCIVTGSSSCGYTPRAGAQPDFRGLMTWSINWDKYYGWEFQNNHEPFLNSLP